jgi:hypothetical protein
LLPARSSGLVQPFARRRARLGGARFAHGELVLKLAAALALAGFAAACAALFARG